MSFVEFLQRHRSLLAHNKSDIRAAAIAQVVSTVNSSLSRNCSDLQSSLEVHCVLDFVLQLLADSNWAARQSGSRILGRFSSTVGGWNEAVLKDLGTLDGHIPLGFSLRTLKLEVLVEHGLPLLAAAYDSADKESSSTRKNFSAQRDELLQLLVAGADDFANLDATKSNLTGLISPEDLELAGSSSEDNSTIGLRGENLVHVVTGSASTSQGTDSPRDAAVHPFLTFCNTLRLRLLSTQWERRHGAASALATMLSYLPVRKSGASPVSDHHDGTSRRATNWLEDGVVRCICIVALDHFGDYSGERLVRPAVEAAAQLLGVIVALLGPNYVRSGGVVSCLSSLRAPKNPFWNIRHGAMLAARFVCRAMFVLHPTDVRAAATSGQHNDGSTGMAACKNFVLTATRDALQNDTDSDVVEITLCVMNDVLEQVNTVSLLASGGSKAISDIYLSIWQRVEREAVDALAIATSTLVPMLLNAANSIYDLLSNRPEHHSDLPALFAGSEGAARPRQRALTSPSTLSLLLRAAKSEYQSAASVKVSLLTLDILGKITATTTRLQRKDDDELLQMFEICDVVFLLATELVRVNDDLTHGAGVSVGQRAFDVLRDIMRAVSLLVGDELPQCLSAMPHMKSFVDFLTDASAPPVAELDSFRAGDACAYFVCQLALATKCSRSRAEQPHTASKILQVVERAVTFSPCSSADPNSPEFNRELTRTAFLHSMQAQIHLALCNSPATSRNVALVSNEAALLHNVWNSIQSASRSMHFKLEQSVDSTNALRQQYATSIVPALKILLQDLSGQLGVRFCGFAQRTISTVITLNLRSTEWTAATDVLTDLQYILSLETNAAGSRQAMKSWIQDLFDNDRLEMLDGVGAVGEVDTGSDDVVESTDVDDGDSKPSRATPVRVQRLLNDESMSSRLALRVKDVLRRLKVCTVPVMSIRMSVVHQQNVCAQAVLQANSSVTLTMKAERASARVYCLMTTTFLSEPHARSGDIGPECLTALMESIKLQHALALQRRSATTLARLCAYWHGRVTDGVASAAERTSFRKIMSNVVLYLRPDFAAYNRWFSETATKQVHPAVRNKLNRTHGINHMEEEKFVDAV